MSEPNQSGLSDNAAGAIAYVTFIPAVLFLILEPFNRNPYVRFHAWQSILLAVAAFVIDMALSFLLAFTWAFAPFIHLAIWPLIQLCWLLVWILCVYNAFSGKRFKLPVIGAIAEQQANR
jgi:uncharacterized membrane protein